jgi:hypothetical protein
MEQNKNLMNLGESKPCHFQGTQKVYYKCRKRIEKTLCSGDRALLRALLMRWGSSSYLEILNYLEVSRITVNVLSSRSRTAHA